MEDRIFKCFVLLFFYTWCGYVSGSSLSGKNTLVFGPGIHPKRSSLPVNYFFIQAIDKDGKNFTDITDNPFVITLSSDSNKRVRRRLETIHTGNGLFLCQYRVYDNIPTLIISITYHEQPVAGSPFTLHNVMHEDCACPLRGVEEWMTDHQCSLVETQIQSDLEPFQKDGVNIVDLYERASKLYQYNSFVHYSIVDGKLYARTFGSIVGFKFLSDMILLSIVNKMQIPNLELIVNLGDWPLNKKNRELLPTFSWCGSSVSRDIVWPTWDLMKSTIMGMDRVTLSILTATKTQGSPQWEERQPRAFFRGRDSNQARLDLVKHHRNNTDLFDVGIVAWFFFKNVYNEWDYGPVANRVSFHDFFNYKYQINIDGTVAAYRFPYLMAGGSLILKQDSDYYEHFYHKLMPWVHYIPVKQDISDLEEKLEWAKENDDRAKEIATNAVHFAMEELLPQKLYCYIALLLKEYAKLQVGTPKIHDGMEPVVPEIPHDCSQVCQQLQVKSTTNKQQNVRREEL